MILRTPPPKKQRSDAFLPIAQTPPDGSNRRLVIYEDNLSGGDVAVAETQSDHMLCTYQCRQMVKSDFFDALSSAEKQVQDYQSKLEALNGNFTKTEDERKKFRDQLLYANQELAAAEGREHALQDQLLKELNDSQEKLKKELLSLSEVEIKLENETNLRKKAESSAASAAEKVVLLEGQLSHLSDNLEREKRRLSNDIEHLKGESRLSVSRINANLERMECRARNAEIESILLTEQLEDLKKTLNECLSQKNELEKKLSDYTIQEGSRPTEGGILVKQLQEELRTIEFEVREARKLKSSHENIAVVKEKLLEEKGRRERAESELSQLQEFQLHINQLEDELSCLKSTIKDIPGVSCPNDIPIKFASLQKDVIDSMIKVGEANARLKQMEVVLDTAQVAKQNAETEVSLCKEKAESLQADVKRMDMMLSMVTQERDMLKTVVSGFTSSKNGDAGDETASKTFIKELESSLANKEQCIKELENALLEQKENENRQIREIDLLHEKLNNEAKRLKSLERESDRFRSEISLLESKLGHGDYSAANTKVLRMVNTLAVDNEAKQTIEALQTELLKTKEKLQAVEELKSQSGEAGKLVDSHIAGKMVQLKEQIATLEKREERYKTVFADKISVFRRACCELFGYKIVMDEHPRPNGIPVTHFTLQSIYAQSEDEKLEFEYESGNTNILANDYTSQREISRQLDIFIQKMHSIPAFTANLTVESFNKRTLS